MKFRVKLDNSVAVGGVDLHCHPQDIEKVTNIVLSLEEKISVKKDGETYLLEPKVILYFEAVENKIFVYTEEEVYETNWKLYELEKRFDESSFF